MTWNDVLSSTFDFSHFGELLPIVQNSLWAGLILGILGGIFGVFVMGRDLAFAVHGISELSFAGASFALLIGANVIIGSIAGSVCAALILALMGWRARAQNSVIGVLMPFGLGLGILFLSLYKGRSSNKFGLLTGQIISVDSVQLGTLVIASCVVLLILAFIWRPLTFASVDAVVARTRGVPVGLLGVVFMLLLAIAVALSIQVVGALLVLALLITPAAAAMRIFTAPLAIVLASVIFAVSAMLGGTLLSLGGTIPISPYITTVSFAIYLVCRVIEFVRNKRLRTMRKSVESSQIQVAGAGRLTAQNSSAAPADTAGINQ